MLDFMRLRPGRKEIAKADVARARHGGGADFANAFDLADRPDLVDLARSGVATVRKVDLAKSDDRPETFGEALGQIVNARLAARERTDGAGRPSTFDEQLAEIARTGRVPTGKTAASPRPADVAKAPYRSVVRQGQFTADREVGEQTVDLIQHVTAAVSAEVFAKLNENLEDILAVAIKGAIRKAESAAQPEESWDQRHERQVAERRNELKAIDLGIALRKSGMLDLIREDPAPRRELTKEEQEAARTLALNDFGLTAPDEGDK